jgi:peptidyl-prolyl cis-trans isomerase SurA
MLRSRTLARLLTVALIALVCAACGALRWVGIVDKDEPPKTGASKKEGSRKPVTGAVPTARGAPAPQAAAAEPSTAEPPAAKPAKSMTAVLFGDEDGVVDRVVAVVNNDVITLNELRETVLYFKIESRQTGSDDEELARQLLARLIESRLQIQEADRERLTVEDVEISEELASRMKKANAPSEQEFEVMLRRQGLTIDVVRKKLREQLMIAKVVRRKVAFRVSVTEQEVDRYLADNRDKLETGLTYHARHILIPLAGDPTEASWAEARQRAEGVLARLRDGADFAEVAREVSKDVSAKEGGDLGSLRKGELAEEIESAILKLAPGQVSAPVRTGLGYHLFKLETKESLDGEGLARVRQQIRDILFREKYQARLEAWLAEIKQRAVIEIRI